MNHLPSFTDLKSSEFPLLFEEAGVVENSPKHSHLRHSPYMCTCLARARIEFRKLSLNGSHPLARVLPGRIGARTFVFLLLLPSDHALAGHWSCFHLGQAQRQPPAKHTGGALLHCGHDESAETCDIALALEYSIF